MRLSILKTLILISSLTVPLHLSLAQEEIPEEDVLREAEISATKNRIDEAQSYEEKLAVIKYTLKNFPAEEISIKAAGNFQVWATNKDLRIAAINDAEFMSAIESHMQGEHSSSYSARLLSVVYGDLVEENTMNVDRLKFVETLIASRRTNQTGLRILLSAWAPQNSDLSIYFESPKIKASFLKILKSNVQDLARHRLIFFLAAVHDATESKSSHPLFGDKTFSKLFETARQEDDTYQKNLALTRQSSARETQSAAKLSARCANILKTATKWLPFKPKR